LLGLVWVLDVAGEFDRKDLFDVLGQLEHGSPVFGGDEPSGHGVQGEGRREKK